jgi:hypothetical protein
MIEILLGKLIEEKNQSAHRAMQAYGRGSKFEYGRYVGVYAGLTVAIQLLEETLAGKDGDEEHDQRRRVRSNWPEWETD